MTYPQTNNQNEAHEENHNAPHGEVKNETHEENHNAPHGEFQNETHVVELFEEELVYDDENATSEEEYESEENYDDYDYYNGFDDLITDEPKAEMHPSLVEDIGRVKQKYGEKAITFRSFEVLGDVNVDLHIPCNHFNNEVSKAWRINNKEDIIVRLHMNLRKYLGIQPTFEVFQPSQPERFGVASQMKSILRLYLAANTFVNDDFSVKLTDSNIVVSKQTEVATNATKTPNSHIAVVSKQKEVTTDAAKILDSHITAVSKLTEDATGAVKFPERDTKIVSKWKKIWKLKKKGKEKKITLEPPAADVDTENERDPLTAASKPQPSRDAGFLAMIYDYCCQRLDTLNEFCVICDEPHLFQRMLKPAVCVRPLCLFAFQDLGVMADATEDISTASDVVDLLITMAKAACKSDRRSIIFNPFPAVVDPMNSQHLALNPAEKNFQRCARALSALDMHELCPYNGAELKKFLDNKDTLAYPLLQWLMVSNRSHIVKLPENRRLSFMNTPHQFLLMSSPPAKEALFQKYKRQYGSTFAFHGSKTENWHAIIRNGLMNASETKYQVHSLIRFGKGIYLSPSGQMSFGYCYPQAGLATPIAKANATGSPFLKADRGVICLALCEVITSPELRKNPDEEWVMPDPDQVCTRFFFVYDGDNHARNNSKNGIVKANVHTQREPYQSAIRRAVDNK